MCKLDDKASNDYSFCSILRHIFIFKKKIPNYYTQFKLLWNKGAFDGD